MQAHLLCDVGGTVGCNSRCIGNRGHRRALRLAGGAVNNDRGQVLFYAELVGGGAALIVATPTRDRGGDEGGE